MAPYRLSTVGLLWLLWSRTTGPRRRWGRILAAFLTLVLIASSPFVASAPSAIRDALQGRLLPLALLAFLLAGGWEALHGHSWFRRFFCLSGILLAAGGIWCAVSYAITGVLYAPLDTALAVLFGMGYFSTFFSLIEPFLLVAAFLVVIHDFIRETARRDAEFQTLAARTALAGEQLAIMEERDRALRSQAHDTRHHWAVLLGLLRERQPDRAEEYLESLSEREIGTPAVYTAHPAVNAILTTALSSAQDLHIETEIRVELPERLSIPDTDLCVLLMNLLDNALDANKKAPEGAKRWLRFTMHIRGSTCTSGWKMPALPLWSAQRRADCSAPPRRAALTATASSPPRRSPGNTIVSCDWRPRRAPSPPAQPSCFRRQAPLHKKHPLPPCGRGCFFIS